MTSPLALVPQKAVYSIKRLINWFQRRYRLRTGKENDALYRLLYLLVHDKDQSLELSSLQTLHSFAAQWRDLPTGNALLSDAWFKAHVARILCEEELLLKPDWFKGKRVLDAGCGNGRWSYGLAQLGADITAVDINPSALESANQALTENGYSARFIQSPLETLDQVLDAEVFDLVFSWGVVHHCASFNKSLNQLAKRVADGGVLYLYLYGRESMSFERDLELFKERVIYNTLCTSFEKETFLLEKAMGDRKQIHVMHDLYAPLLNRRLSFDEVRDQLQSYGFSHIERTIDHTELFIRAVKGPKPIDAAWILPPKQKPFWFERYN